jgi:type IV pilus assembly protein PilV
MPQSPTHRAVNQKGMTFIEVLIALVIMVTGILGAVAMQATAKKGSFDAMQRSLASSLAQDIVERMRSNDATALANYAGTDYGVSLNDVPSKRCKTSDALCTVTEMATNDRYEWEMALMGANVKNGSKNAGGLVNSRACVSVNNNAVTVVITWQGRTELVNGSTEGCGATGSNRRQVVVEAFVF